MSTPKKILIMSGTYYPRPLANGICVHQIALELKDMGYEVHVICYGNRDFKSKAVFDGIFAYPVKKRLVLTLRDYAEEIHETTRGQLYYKIAMLMNKFKKVLYLPFYPMTSLSSIIGYYRAAEKLHRKHSFDIIISVYNPLDALAAGMMMKKKWKNLKFVLYILDSLTNDGGNKYLSTEWAENKGWQWEKTIYKAADKILNLKCHEKHHQKERYQVFKDKMEVVDIPLLRPLDNRANKPASPFEEGYLHWVYAGAIDIQYRNPKYLCQLFEAININQQYKMHFYSRGDCEDIIMDFQKRTNGHLIRHGYVGIEESVNAVSNADILISIGNSNSDMIPSKIFEYMSTGKKIIHFYQRENDSCLSYYQQYGQALLLNEKDKFEDNMEKVENFIQASQVEISYDKLKAIYYKNLPSYTANIIDEMLKVQ